MNSIENLRNIEQKIKQARISSSLAASDIDLIAVSKTHQAKEIEPLLIVGHKNFGENRVQEAKEKWLELRKKYPETKLHLIGSLQTNKVKEAIKLFDVIHTIDRINLVDEIVKELAKNQHHAIEFFIQVNIGNEAQKGGVALEGLEELINYTKNKLQVIGLMCVPPADDPPDKYFSLLHELAKKYNLHSLSMGMSEDYETAIKFGATHIRVGTAIFGKRNIVDKL